MTELGFLVLPGSHPIVPVKIGDATEAARLAAELHAGGVYAVSFSSRQAATARIRAQMSAAHMRANLDRAAAAFVAARAAAADLHPVATVVSRPKMRFTPVRRD
jgi:glycine C-acetyltransferase